MTTSLNNDSLRIIHCLWISLVLILLASCQSTTPPPTATTTQDPVPEQTETITTERQPTYISPELHIQSYLKEASADLSISDQLVAPWSLMIPVFSPDGGQQYVVTNCLQALSAAQQGVSPDNPVAFPQFRYAVVQCMAMQLTENMQPAVQSHFGPKIIEDNFLDQMPASSAFVVTEQDALRARTTQGSAADISPVQRLQPNGQYRTTFDLGFGSQTVTVLAHGDVNQDGIEDALLQVVNTEYNGTYRLAFLYIVTKPTPNSPLQLIGGY